jgi:hypothetical protein
MVLFIAFLVGVLCSLLLCALVPLLDKLILLLRGGCATLFGIIAAICDAAKDYLDKHDSRWSHATSRE